LVGFTGAAFFFDFCIFFTRTVADTGSGVFFESGFVLDFAEDAALATDFFFFVPRTNSFDTGTFLEAVVARLVFFTGDIDSFRFGLVDDFDEADRFATTAGLLSCESDFLFEDLSFLTVVVPGLVGLFLALVLDDSSNPV
jgi:hypothetical protein